MKGRVIAPLAILLAILALCAACSAKPDYTARFLRYTKLEDGSRAAVVTPVGNDPSEQQTAFTDISDLKPDERVLIHFSGKSWDSPQWTPQREIISRAPTR